MPDVTIDDKKDLKEEIERNDFHVAIFGSARIDEDSEIYRDVYCISRLIAARGMDVVTGGGPGLMEAASKGLQDGRKDESVHSVGLSIKLPKEQNFNPHLDVQHEFERFSNRLDHFMVLSNVVVVAPGGIGTTLELFYTWQLAQVKHICNIPIILYGEMWEKLMDWIKEWPLKNNLMSEKDLNNIHIAKSPDEVMEIITDYKKHFDEMGDAACLNYKKYKIL